MNTRPCKSCGMELVFAHSTETGAAIPLVAKKVPVYDINADGAAVKVGDFYISHYINCPQASTHSKKAPPMQAPPAESDEMPPLSDEERYANEYNQRSSGQAQGGFAMPMPFGKHKGTPLIRLPSNYIEWILREMKDLRPPLRSGLEAALEKKKASKEQSQ